jgi:TrmH family RNA methyltransferase
VTRAQLQLLRSLRDKRGREEHGLYVVEGERIVGELLAAGHSFVDVYGTEEWKGPRTQDATGSDMAKASHFPTPSPVLAVGRIRREPLGQRELANGLSLALDGVQDPGNVGTILRVADWFGFARVVLSPSCADLHSQKVIQASMGSFARVRAAVSPLSVLGEAGVPVVGCELGGRSVHALEPVRDAIFVIGSEGRGLSEEVKSVLSYSVTIPRAGGGESLNAAIAAAVICDNVRRALG